MLRKMSDEPLNYLVDGHSEVLLGKEVSDEIAVEKKEVADSLKVGGKYVDSVVVDQNYPYISYDGPMRHIPLQARKLFGCHNCEWRGTSLCPFGIKRSVRLGRISHSEGICEMRLNYLKSFYRGSRERPTYTEWINDYNQGVAQLQLQDDLVKLKRIEEKLKEYEDDGEEFLAVVSGKDGVESESAKKYKVLTVLRSSAREDWFNLWKLLMDNDQKRMDRETPKKLEIDNKSTISISDFQKLVKRADGKIVDAEYDEIDD